MPLNPILYPSAAGYMPYFYQTGLFQRYDLPGKKVPGYALDSGLATYQFSRDQPFLKPEKQCQTVEDILHRGYLAIPQGDPATAIISDKSYTSHMGLDDVIRQIRTRYEIFEQNLYDIELSKCSALNALFSREAQMGKPSDSRQEYSVSKVLQTLYKQEREERVSLWQDISKLKLALPELAQQYLTAYRKRSLLEDEEDDNP